MKKNAWLRLLFLAAVMILIYVQSSFPEAVSSAESAPLARLVGRFLDLDLETATFLVRKGGHILEYLLLGAAAFSVLSLVIPGNGAANYLLSAFLSWAGGTLYAAADEFHQSFVPGRSAEFRDVCIDSAGVFAGILAFLLLEWILSQDPRYKERNGEK